MKAVFDPKEKEEVLDQLKEIAKHYDSIVKEEDQTDGHFILVREQKLQIAEKKREGEHLIYVWGASEKDIDYLKSFWGEPIRTTSEKLTPLEFAAELTRIPDIEKISKEQIMEIMELSEKDYDQYKRLLRFASKRPSVASEITKAYEILKNLTQSG